jgi:hypothetical protein
MEMEQDGSPHPLESQDKDRTAELSAALLLARIEGRLTHEEYEALKQDLAEITVGSGSIKALSRKSPDRT